MEWFRKSLLEMIMIVSVLWFSYRARYAQYLQSEVVSCVINCNNINFMAWTSKSMDGIEPFTGYSPYQPDMLIGSDYVRRLTRGFPLRNVAPHEHSLTNGPGVFWRNTRAAMWIGIMESNSCKALWGCSLHYLLYCFCWNLSIDILKLFVQVNGQHIKYHVFCFHVAKS